MTVATNTTFNNHIIEKNDSLLIIDFAKLYSFGLTFILSMNIPSVLPSHSIGTIMNSIETIEKNQKIEILYRYFIKIFSFLKVILPEKMQKKSKFHVKN
jgi:hypothetical protein